MSAVAGTPAILGGAPVRTVDYPSWPVWDDGERRRLEQVLEAIGKVQWQTRRFVVLNAFGPALGVSAQAIVDAAKGSGLYQSVELIDHARRSDLWAIAPTLTPRDAFVRSAQKTRIDVDARYLYGSPGAGLGGVRHGGPGGFPGSSPSPCSCGSVQQPPSGGNSAGSLARIPGERPRPLAGLLPVRPPRRTPRPWTSTRMAPPSSRTSRSA